MVLSACSTRQTHEYDAPLELRESYNLSATGACCNGVPLYLFMLSLLAVQMYQATEQEM